MKMGKASANDPKCNSSSNGIPQFVDTTQPPTAASAMTHKSPTTKCQNDDHQKPSSGHNNDLCIKFLINLLIYAICILSLSISCYLSYRQAQLESNVKSLMYLDNKVLRIESDLDDLIRKTSRLYPSLNIAETINNNGAYESTKRDSIIAAGDSIDVVDADDDDDDANDDESSSSSNSNRTNGDGGPIVNKLPVHVYSEITRLKRDVSNLKMARRQRQTNVQQSPNENCLCPPGESLHKSFLFTLLLHNCAQTNQRTNEKGENGNVRRWKSEKSLLPEMCHIELMTSSTNIYGCL